MTLAEAHVVEIEECLELLDVVDAVEAVSAADYTSAERFVIYLNVEDYLCRLEERLA